jgi:hypothetical protein
MNDVADVPDAGLEDPVRRWIGDHDRRQIGTMGLRLGPQIAEVDVAVVVTCDDDDFHPRHVRRRGVGAVRRRGNEADFAQRLALRGVVRLDDQEARVFALRAGVGLQRHGGGARRRYSMRSRPPIISR